MSDALFPHAGRDELTFGMRAFSSRFDAAVIVAERDAGGLAGFVEVGARAYAEGCDTSPVGYIEAWYVDADMRGQGVGRALVAAAEEWARAQGYSEVASDALVENEASHRAHRALGFDEVERSVAFRKSLDASRTSAAATATDCLFCRIVAGAAPGTFVYRDDQCAAFMDIQPVNPGHMLVVPLRHAAHLADLDPMTAGRMTQVAQSLAAALRRSGVRCEGVNLFLADGAAAMQEIFHMHLHVFPRFKGDGFGLRFGPEYSTRPTRKELEEVARLIGRGEE